jgi:uncharacterized protein (TIGR02231 family)
MKYISLLLLYLTGSFLWAQENEMEITPSLVSATVYLNSAELNYSTSVQLPAGKVKLVFKGLSPYLIRESLSLKGVGKADIINISYRNDYLINKRDNRKIREIQKKLEQTRRKINILQARKNALNDEIQLLKTNGKRDKAPLSVLKQYIDYYQKRYTEIQKNIFDIDLKINPLKEKAAKLQKQLDELTGQAKRKAKDLIVSLYVPQSGTFDFSLTYITRRAGWKPAYTIRSQGPGSALKWQYQAEITQQTGIDWDNIPVTLSTLQPQFNLHIPVPNPWYLDNIQHVYEMSAPVARNKRAVKAESKLAYEESRITETDIDIQYTLKKRYSVLSGNEPVLVHLQSFESPAEHTYFSVPYISPAAYLIAYTSELNKRRLIPGKARLYYKDRYAGETYINPRSEAEKIKLPFGIDREIIVTRKKTGNYKDHKNLGSKILVKREYTITVKNTKKTAVNIEIRDRIPVSQDEKIEVKNIRITGNGKRNSKGIVTWKLHLEPGEKRELKIYFEVKYPKDYNINL